MYLEQAVLTVVSQNAGLLAVVSSRHSSSTTVLSVLVARYMEYVYLSGRWMFSL